MKICSEVWPFLIGVLLFSLLLGCIGVLLAGNMIIVIMVCALVVVILSGYLLYFFRDPERVLPQERSAIVSAADGIVTSIKMFNENEFRLLCEKSGMREDKLECLKGLLRKNVIRISIFLSLWDVHVNRAPISGLSEYLGYFPGKRIFTFKEKSSDENQHNAIYLQNDKTACLIYQIVGPLARRVVYWHDKENAVYLKKGEKIGMMKFGSRLDMYFPEDTVIVTVKPKEHVCAGTSIIAMVKE